MHEIWKFKVWTPVKTPSPLNSSKIEYWGNMEAATVQNSTALAVILEDARQRLCGYRTHFTKLMKEINQILSNESPSNLSKFQELVDLKSKAKAALDVYVAAVKKLGAESDDQEAEYLAEMSKMMKNFGSRFTAFVAAATEAGSGYSSSESSKPHSLSGSISSRKSISKSVKNAVDAEVNLALIRQTATLTLESRCAQKGTGHWKAPSPSWSRRGEVAARDEGWFRDGSSRSCSRKSPCDRSCWKGYFAGCICNNRGYGTGNIYPRKGQ